MSDTRILQNDMVMQFGDRNDGVIGLPCLTAEGQVIEASYFFGKSKPKNIAVISSQIGCPMSCRFCELGPVRFVRNLMPEEMAEQVRLLMEQARRHYGFSLRGEPHKVTVANSGEPLLNPELIVGLDRIAGLGPVSFKVSTILPSVARAEKQLTELAHFARSYSRPVQLQISLISTSNDYRYRFAGVPVAGLEQVIQAGHDWQRINPNGRKVNLSLMMTRDKPICAERVARQLPKGLFRIRLREYVPTVNGNRQGLKPATGGRILEAMKVLAEAGHEVGDWGLPSPTERRFGLTANSIRQLYLSLVG